MLRNGAGSGRESACQMRKSSKVSECDVCSLSVQLLREAAVCKQRTGEDIPTSISPARSSPRVSMSLSFTPRAIRSISSRDGDPYLFVNCTCSQAHPVCTPAVHCDRMEGTDVLNRRSTLSIRTSTNLSGLALNKYSSKSSESGSCRHSNTAE
jgi:hypothetical protein